MKTHVGGEASFAPTRRGESKSGSQANQLWHLLLSPHLAVPARMLGASLGMETCSQQALMTRFALAFAIFAPSAAHRLLHLPLHSVALLFASSSCRRRAEVGCHVGSRFAPAPSGHFFHTVCVLSREPLAVCWRDGLLLLALVRCRDNCAPNLHIGGNANKNLGRPPWPPSCGCRTTSKVSQSTSHPVIKAPPGCRTLLAPTRHPCPVGSFFLVPKHPASLAPAPNHSARLCSQLGPLKLVGVVQN